MARDRDNGLVGVEGTGGGRVGDGVGGKNNGLRRDGSGLRQGLVQGGEKGYTRFRQRGNRGKAKIRVFFALNRTMSRLSDATSRHSREESSQRRDVEIQRRDVPERCKTNVATLRSTQRHDVPEKGQTDIATFQRRPKIKIIQPWSKVRENSPRAIVTLWTFAVLCMNGSSPVLLIAGPESRHPKRDSDYRHKQQTNIT